jgi:hypothetical protein
MAIAIPKAAGESNGTRCRNKSTDNLLEFVVSDKARASPAQHSVFLRLRHNELLSVQLEAVIVGRGKQD